MQCAAIFPLLGNDAPWSGHPWADLTVLSAILRNLIAPSRIDIQLCSRLAALLQDALSHDAQISVVGLLDDSELIQVSNQLEANSVGSAKPIDAHAILLRVIERLLNFCSNFSTQQLD